MEIDSTTMDWAYSYENFDIAMDWSPSHEEYEPMDWEWSGYPYINSILICFILILGIVYYAFFGPYKVKSQSSELLREPPGPPCPVVPVFFPVFLDFSSFIYKTPFGKMSSFGTAQPGHANEGTIKICTTTTINYRWETQSSVVGNSTTEWNCWGSTIWH